MDISENDFYELLRGCIPSEETRNIAGYKGGSKPQQENKINNEEIPPRLITHLYMWRVQARGGGLEGQRFLDVGQVCSFWGEN